MNISNDVTQIWNFLGDVWQNIDNQDQITSSWTASLSGVSLLLNRTMDIQNSRAFQFMPPIMDVGNVEYIFVYSGLALSTDTYSVVTPLSTGGIFSYTLDNWTLSIPTFIQTYKYNNTTVNYTYTEGVDYTISGLNNLIWLTTPHWDQRYSSLMSISLYAPMIKRINPILMNSWARALNFDIINYNNYTTFTDGTLDNLYKHLLYLVWALSYERTALPTIQNMTNGLAIAAGYPFAYVSGLVNSTPGIAGKTNLTIDGYSDVYYIPSGIAAVSTGTYVNQFDLLIQDAHLYDYFNNPTEIEVYANVLTNYHTLVLSLPSMYKFGIDAGFFTRYTSRLLPVHYYVFFPQGGSLVDGNYLFQHNTF